MKDNKDLKIKSIKIGDRKLQDLFDGVDADMRKIDDTPGVAQNLQSYENYLNRNSKKKKKD